MDSKTFNLLKKLLSHPVAFHRIFASIGGGATEGLFLSQAYYWSQHTKDPEGWFYKTSEEWNEETTLTRREQETARRSLRGLGILKEKRKGQPAKLFYQVDVECLYQLIYESSTPNSQIAKSDKLDNKIAKSDNQECHFLQTEMSEVTNKSVISDIQSIYTETTPEITSETTSERIPPNPQTENREQGEGKSQPIAVEILESGSDLNQIYFPEQQKPESLPETKNLSLGQSSAAPLKNGFQQLSGLNPKSGKDYFPWQGMENNRVAIDPKFLEFVAKTLTSKYPFYQNLTVNLLAGEVKKYVRRAEHEDQRLAEVWDYWDEYLNPTELPDVTFAQIKSATASEKMIEALRARGYQ